jgi:hypothetical protein
VSDQDFFFDEDEKPAKSQSKSAPAKKPASSPAKGGATAPAGSEQSVSLTIAALIGVAALLLGVIIGVLIPVNVGSSQTATPDAGLTTTGAVQAPQLTPEQMQSGQLPPGHPSVGATGSAPTTP